MKLLFTGDVLLKDESYKTKLIGRELQKIIHEHEIVCCNLEGPCISKNAEQSRKRGPSVFQGENAIQRLKDGGVNTLVLANNHMMDYGEEGLRTTLDAIKDDFYYAGAELDEESVYRILEIKNNEKNIGILSMAECAFGSSLDGNGGCAWMMHEKVIEMFEAAKERCDYFFVVCHCGAEELDVPFPEVKQLYREFIDKGAAAVIGHHPHVIQGTEKYKGKDIFYSLGNFAFDSLENPLEPYNPTGLCVSIEIEENGTVNCRKILTYYKNGQVNICHENDEWDRVNALLKDKGTYEELVNEYCAQLFEKHFKCYITAAVGLDAENKDSCEKFVYYRLLGKPLRWDYLFLYHNIAVETNLWICRRAIRVLGYLR